MDLDSFFENLAEFEYSDLFENINNIWDPLINLEDAIIRKSSSLKLKDNLLHQLDGVTTKNFVARNGEYQEHCLLVNEWVETTDPVYLKSAKIFIDKGTLLEPTAIIKGPAIISTHCDIRQGAYIRGNAVIGSHSVIGHCTELKNSIIMNHTEAGHFNYIGDSILGSFVNLGAGSKLANLQLRTVREKRNGIIYPIKLNLEQENRINTGMGKLGAVLGDFVEVGCNTVISPGTFIGKRCWAFPSLTVAKGFYKPDKIINSKTLQTD